VDFLSKIFYRKADLATRFLRLNLVSITILYLLFGLLDPFTMPITYSKAWCVRTNFAIIISFFALYSFRPNISKEVSRRLILLTVIIASLGIFIIGMLAQPNEYAYLHYPMGQCLIVVWVMTAYRLRASEMLFFSLAITTGFLFITMYVQKLHTYPVGSIEKSAFATGIFFISSILFLATYGTWRYNNYMDRIRQKREMLKREKNKLSKAIVKAEESERLKSAFLANMSHEIRTPMHAVLGFSHLLRRPDLPAEKQQKFLDLIENKGNQLLGLIDNILDLSRIDAQMVELEYKYFPADELINSLRDQMLNSILQRHGKANLKIKFECPQDTPLIFADFNRLSLVLFHLLDNAVKFTANGTIICTYEHSQASNIFTVEDTGEGIPPEMQDLIFQRFRQSSDELNRCHSGTGLGLSIVTGLLELMKGRIQLSSQIGKGSVFTVFIPAHDAI
jgi:signal transduction histidine kinase